MIHKLGNALFTYRTHVPITIYSTSTMKKNNTRYTNSEDKRKWQKKRKKERGEEIKKLLTSVANGEPEQLKKLPPKLTYIHA